jgi:hypothetical protein
MLTDEHRVGRKLLTSLLVALTMRALLLHMGVQGIVWLCGWGVQGIVWLCGWGVQGIVWDVRGLLYSTHAALFHKTQRRFGQLDVWRRTRYSMVYQGYVSSTSPSPFGANLQSKGLVQHDVRA